MSKKFYAENRETGQRWIKDPRQMHQYLVMYDSGYLAVVTEYRYEGSSITPLDTKVWKTVLKGEGAVPPVPKTPPQTKTTCPSCDGEGQTSEIIDHDYNYNSVWGKCECMRCNGTGFLITYK